MSDITELEGRITAALDRIRRGLVLLSQPGDAPGPQVPPPPQGDVAALQERLEEERTVNAQLEERVRALKERQDGRLAQLEARIEEQKGRMSALDREMQSVRQANAELRDMTSQLRSALSQNVAEPELVNRAVLAELDALRATRSADIAEVDAVLAELKPLIEEAR